VNHAGAPPACLAACPSVASPPRPLAVLIVLLAAGCLAAPARVSAQSGGTPAPGPGYPCPAIYPGDDADKASIARWMGRGAALRDLPQALPVMAGLAESGLRNLNTRGNRFAGFFGMHLSLDKGPYRGFPRNPELQLRWFADTAVAVRQREIAEGDEDFGRDPSGYGLWIADVERPAAENREGYQPYLDDAQALLGGSCRPSDHLPDTQPPSLRVNAAARQRRVVVLSVRCPAEPCMAGAQAEPRSHVRQAPAVAVESDAVTLTLPARTRRSATRLEVTVTAVDEAGNATRKEQQVTMLR
jgi:hypothetical protein